MKNSEREEIPNEEKRRNMITGLGVGAALGVVFWSALDGLLPVPFDLILGLATGLIVGYNLGKRPIMLMQYPPFIVRRLMLAVGAFVLGTLAYTYIIEFDLNSAQRILASMLAIVPAIGLIVAVASAIAHLDELQRRIQTEAIAIAFAGTAMVVVSIIFLGFSGVTAPGWGWILIVMTTMWLLGKLWTMWRYG